MKSQKQALRQELKSRLKKAITEDLCQRVQREVQQFLEKTKTTESISTIGVFAPLSDEISIDWDQLSCQTSYPFWTGEGQMEFKLASKAELEQGQSFGVVIFAPKGDAKTIEPDLLFIPGLGFGPQGQRLGRGKGYYDRYLSSYKGLKIGIGLETQIENELPCEEHDIALDGLITEHGFKSFTPTLHKI